jgi:hypothetical protein
LPDDDELEQAGDDLLDPNASPEDVLVVEALMGWDGDPCLCADCACPRFRDGIDERCQDCREGRHWSA